MTNDKANEIATIIKELIYCMIIEESERYSLTVRISAAKDITDSYKDLVKALETVQCNKPIAALLGKHALKGITTQKDSQGINYM